MADRRLNRLTSGWRILIAAVLVVGLAAVAQATRADEPGRITLVIDYGDGVEKRFTALEYRSGMTILDAMEAAQRHPRGIKFEYRGRAATGFLTRIDDLKNEGQGRNWLYRVNDKPGERSFAVETLKAGDTVSWKFSARE